jgi:hypothetical protein
VVDAEQGHDSGKNGPLFGDMWLSNPVCNRKTKSLSMACSACAMA